MPIQPSVNHPINCGVATTPSFARQFSKLAVADRSADLELFAEYSSSSSGSTQTVDIGDATWTVTTFPSSVTNIRANISYLPEKFSNIKSITSGNTSILSNPTLGDSTLLQYVSSGTTSVTVNFETNEKITKSATTVQRAEAYPVYTFQGFKNGSLAKHIYDQTMPYANGSTSYPSHLQVYSNYDFTNNIYVKNTGNWLYPLDFSGLAVNRVSQSFGGVRSMTAITPYHVVGSGHYAPQGGDVYYFCTPNNQIISRTIQSITTNLGFAQDVCVARLTEPLPSSIKKYKTFPDNILNYCPINKQAVSPTGFVFNFRFSNVPVIVFSHYRWDAEWQLQRPNRYSYLYATSAINYPFGDGGTLGYQPNYDFPLYNGQPSGIRGGDSGSPVFFVVNNDLVLATNHSTASSGSFYPLMLDNLQSAIDFLGPSGQTIQTVDLSGFTDFSS